MKNLTMAKNYDKLFRYQSNQVSTYDALIADQSKPVIKMKGIHTELQTHECNPISGIFKDNLN